MKLNRLNWFPRNETELIAIFGSARLVRKTDGRHELVGGTADELVDAREWCSLYAHGVVFTSQLRSHSTRAFTA